MSRFCPFQGPVYDGPRLEIPSTVLGLGRVLLGFWNQRDPQSRVQHQTSDLSFGYNQRSNFK